MIYYTNYYTNFEKDIPRYATICQKGCNNNTGEKVKHGDNTLKYKRNSIVTKT